MPTRTCRTGLGGEEAEGGRAAGGSSADFASVGYASYSNIEVRVGVSRSGGWVHGSRWGPRDCYLLSGVENV